MNELDEIKADQSDYCSLFKFLREHIGSKLIKPYDVNELSEAIVRPIYSPRAQRINSKFYDLMYMLSEEFNAITYSCACEECSPIQTISVSNPYFVDIKAEVAEREKKCKNFRFCELIKNNPDEVDATLVVCDKCK